jgi:hypothetical protein
MVISLTSILEKFFAAIAADRLVIYLGHQRGSATPVVERATGKLTRPPQRGVTQVAKRRPPPPPDLDRL